MKYLFFLFISAIAFGQQNKSLDSLQKVIVENYAAHKNDLEVSYKKSSIPGVLKRKLKKELGDFKIADPDEEYRTTDRVHNSRLPHRQMQFSIRNSNYFTMVFNQGGRGFSTYFVFSEIVDNEIIIMEIYNVDREAQTVKGLLKVIENGEFYK